VTVPKRRVVLFVPYRESDDIFGDVSSIASKNQISRGSTAKYEPISQSRESVDIRARARESGRSLVAYGHSDCDRYGVVEQISKK
jgi:hypothetical protein